VQSNTVHFRGNIYGNPANQFWKAEGCLTIKQTRAIGTNQPAKCQKPWKVTHKKEIKGDELKGYQPWNKKSVCPEPVKANTFPPSLIRGMRLYYLPHENVKSFFEHFNWVYVQASQFHNGCDTGLKYELSAKNICFKNHRVFNTKGPKNTESYKVF